MPRRGPVSDPALASAATSRSAAGEAMKVLATFLALSLTILAFGALSEDDSAFIEKASRGGIAEVEASELAANKATNQQVRAFAMMLVKDHSAANKKLADIAKSKGMQQPAMMSDDQQATLEALQAADGARFDQAYMAQMVKSHEESVQLLKSEIESGQDPATKAYAQEVLPTVEGHLRKAYELTGQEGKAATMPQEH
jgi:putative membrane protein